MKLISLQDSHPPLVIYIGYLQFITQHNIQRVKDIGGSNLYCIQSNIRVTNDNELDKKPQYLNG